VARRIVAIAAAILVGTTTAAWAAPTTWHTKTHLGAVTSSRARSLGCSYATGVIHAGDLRMSCSAGTGHAAASYTFRFTGILMGTPTVTVTGTHTTGLRVTETLTRPSATTLRVTIVAHGKGSDTIRSVRITYGTC
jgi:hypothetical protein